MPKKSFLIENLEYAGVKLLLNFFKYTNYEKGIIRGGKLFKKVFKLFKIEKNIAFANLNIVFKNKFINKKEKLEFFEYLYLKNIENLGKVFFNLFYYPYINDNEFKNLINIINLDIPRNTIKETQKGVIAVSLHSGNWEVFGCAVSLNGVPVSVIVRPLDNKKLDQHIEDYRRSKTVEVLSKFDSPKHYYKAIEKKRVLAILADQNTIKFGNFIPFFKKPASASVGTARIHLFTKGEIIPAYSYYQNEKLFGVFEKPYNFENLYKSLSIEDKFFLFTFNEFFNLNNYNAPISLFDNQIDFSSSISEIFNKKYNYKSELEKFLNEKLSEKENFNDLTKQEKIFFITYFFHKDFEKIILKYPDNWMWIHPRWKKQPKGFKSPYSKSEINKIYN